MMTDRRDTVLFDLDGTLIDPKRRLYTLFAELTHCRLTYEAYWERKDAGYNQKRMLEEVGYDAALIPGFADLWHQEIERQDLLDLDRVFEDVTETIHGLASKGIRMYIVTNRLSLDGVGYEMDRFGLGGSFSGILSTKQQCTKAEAVRRAGVDLAGAVFVGDSREDMETAGALGIPGILLTRGTDRKNGTVTADHYIDNLGELRGILF